MALHEEIYLKAYDSVHAARCGIAQYSKFYNSKRPHQAHNQSTPTEGLCYTTGTSHQCKRG